MTKIFIDIETIPVQNQVWIDEIKAGIKPPATHKKQETIDKWYAEEGVEAGNEAVQKTSFNGGMGQIFCISTAATAEPTVFTRRDLSLEAEAEMLTVFASTMREIAKLRPIHFVGHNISGFDLRFLYHRFVVHGINPGFLLPYNDASWKGSYTDTMELWAGYRDKVSLDNLCKYLNIESPKTELDGSKVWEYVQIGRYQEVQDYCKSDVEALRKVYNRLTFNN